MVRFNLDTGNRGINLSAERGAESHAAKHVEFHFETVGNCITSAPTVHTTLPIRTASQGKSSTSMLTIRTAQRCCRDTSE